MIDTAAVMLSEMSTSFRTSSFGVECKQHCDYTEP